jgi:hypothetical protein
MKRLIGFVLAATLVGICACSRQEKDTPKAVIENPQAQEKDPPKPLESQPYHFRIHSSATQGLLPAQEAQDSAVLSLRYFAIFQILAEMQKKMDEIARCG